MKIMLYCQHVLGIGHLFRSMEIARALHKHAVLFVEGGEHLSGFPTPSHIQRVLLPPLMMDAEFSHVEAASDLEATKSRRAARLRDTFARFAPDILMIELFPFGRKYFQFELIPLLEEIKSRRSDVRVICSLRDILVEKKDQSRYEERVLGILNRYFDLLLVHADPQVVSLKETFSRVAEIDIPIEYTGFVARASAPVARRKDAKLIVVSSGGGKVGVDLLAATIRALPLLDDEKIHLRVFIGPFMEADDADRIKHLAAQYKRVALRPFSPDFLDELSGAALSVSMAGYNTCMDILSSNVNALVYPFPQNREQRMRAERLEELGALKTIHSLDERSLARQIKSAMVNAGRGSKIPVNINGAANTALIVEKYFGRH